MVSMTCEAYFYTCWFHFFAGLVCSFERQVGHISLTPFHIFPSTPRKGCLKPGASHRSRLQVTFGRQVTRKNEKQERSFT